MSSFTSLLGLFAAWALMHIIWFLMMQNGITTSIKPQQVTFIVPGVENFEPTEISDFVQKAQDNLVGSSCCF